MFKLIRRILRFAGESAGRLRGSFAVSFLESLFSNVPILVLLYVLMRILNGTLSISAVWISGGVMLLGILMQCALRRIYVEMESGAGYEICACERMKIGNRFKRFPMSYFTEGNLGRVTSALSVDLLFIEEHGMSILDKVVNAFISTLIGVAMLLAIDFRVGLVSVAICALAALSFRGIEKMAKKQAPIRQRQQGALTSAVLEYTRGISVIKAFNMAGSRAKRIKDAFQETRDHAVEFEEAFVGPGLWYDSVFALGTAATLFAVTYYCFHGTLELSVMLMIAIFVFRLYMPLKSLAGIATEARVMEAALDRFEEVKNVPILDINGRDIALTRFDVAFDNVSFAYGQQEILKNISFTVPPRSMTALVGESGSGKTTIANLIVRFWDVQKGAVRVGGVDVKDMTCDSLLKNISMVFQNVYLFQDTIANNIRFGKPDASMEEIVAAAKAARCHDFIMKLEKGYDTVVGEGGSTLSGGEKQRVSIARAILKNAPIVLLDEATASVDPDNEMHIQAALGALAANKTLIVIAHRLSTIQSADQILVVDHGQIAQRGKHDELIALPGKYRDLWESRMKARGWQLHTEDVQAQRT